MAASDNLNDKQFPTQRRPRYGDYSGKPPVKKVEFAKRDQPLPDILTKPQPKRSA